ncbi:hypothetical protein lerEdw1_004699 [Lerista edwardsae]|nr:hypothetical protein lerEdw1_004699 [Lerista edwardsae]
MEKGAMELGRYWMWLLATLQAISVYGAELSSEACREMGFSSNLLCSSCDLLSQFSLSQLDPFCRKCCQEEAQSETRKVTRQAGVTVKKRVWEQSMKLQKTQHTHTTENSGYVRGSDPVLKLLDDGGNIAEELSILKWNTDSVEEFLSEKLERL